MKSLREYITESSCMSRYRQGGFLPGDEVIIDCKKLRGTDFYKRSNRIMRHKADHLMEGQDECFRLVVVDSDIDDFDSKGEETHLVVVAEEIAPGLTLDPFPIPSEVLEVVDNGINLGRIPKGWVHDRGVETKELDPNEVIDTEKNPDYMPDLKCPCRGDAGNGEVDGHVKGHNPYDKGTPGRLGEARKK